MNALITSLHYECKTHVYTCLFISVKPKTPTVNADSASPTDGDNIILTCTTTTTGITDYEFKKGSRSLTKEASATYTISAAAMGIHDGTYTCIAYVHTVASTESVPFTLRCESVSCWSCSKTNSHDIYIQTDIKKLIIQKI